MQQPYKPHVGDFKISKEPTDGKHWIWRYEISGAWEFITSLSELQAGDFVSDKDFLHSNDMYDYWRISKRSQ